MSTLLKLAVLLCCSTTAYAQNKCTSSDGKVSFQDAPCATGTRAESLNRQAAPVARSGTLARGVPPTGGKGALQLPAIDLTGPPGQRYARAVAALESMDTDGADCVVKLKVYGLAEESMPVCSQFNAQIQQWMMPTLDALKELGSDAEFYAANGRHMQRSLLMASRIQQHAETVKLRMQSLTVR